MAKKGTYKNRIRKAMKEAGTYKTCFEAVISDCAETLNKRDEAEQTFRDSGGHVLVRHTNKGGATNIEQNPALRLVNDLNRDLLKYYSELGLTPKGLKQIDQQAGKTDQATDALTELMEALGT